MYNIGFFLPIVYYIFERLYCISIAQ